MASNSGTNYEKKAHFTYIWAIENASSVTLYNEVSSPTFIIQTMHMTKWHLTADFNDHTNDLQLFICKEEESGSEIFEIDFEFSLIDCDLSPSYAVQTSKSQFKEVGSHSYGVIFNGKHITNLLNTAILSQGTLTVRCRIWKTGYDVTQPELCFARTRLEMVKHCFVWAIRGFSTLRPGQNKTIFLHPTSKNLPTLILTFCLQERDGKEYGEITVHTDPVVGTYVMDVLVCLLDVEGCFVPDSEMYDRGLITDEAEKVCEISEVCEKTKVLSNKDNLLMNDVLSLRCEIIFDAGPVWDRIENYRQLESSNVDTYASIISVIPPNNTENDCCPFKNMLNTLYEDGTFSDISLKADSRIFNVHKSILSARSPGFKSMFISDIKEKTVDIPKLNADTLHRLLLYIYTNRVEEIQWEGASDLFKAAERFELPDLRKICSNFLKSNIIASNVCDILVLADLHRDNDLRKAAQGFISQDSEIFHSVAWGNLKEEHTKLAFETTEQIICNMRNSKR